MSLHQALFKQVDSGVRHRGETYYATGRVKITSHDKTRLAANVQGSKLYAVSLKREDGKVIVECTCPYFEGGTTCKHIWATILTADAQHLLQPSRDERTISLITSAEQDSFMDESEDDNLNDDILSPGLQIRNKSADAPSTRLRQQAIRPNHNNWKEILSLISNHMMIGNREHAWPPDREIIYWIDTLSSTAHGQPVVQLLYRKRKQNGEWSKTRPLRVTRNMIYGISNPLDRSILSIFTGPLEPYAIWEINTPRNTNEYLISDTLLPVILPQLCETGRFTIRNNPTGDLKALRLDTGPAWTFQLEVVRHEQRYLIRGFLTRGEERRELGSPALLVAGGWIFWEDRVSRLDDNGAFGWISILRRTQEIQVPAREADEIPALLYSQPKVPPLTLPADLNYREIAVSPKPCLVIMPPRYPGESLWVWCELRLDYDGNIIPGNETTPYVVIPKQRTVIRRDLAAEEAFKKLLADLQLKYGFDPEQQPRWQLLIRNLTETLSALITQGWRVEAKGCLYRKPGTFKINVTSSMDWFELRGSMDFGGVTAGIPALLKAIRAGENTILLSDGTIGMLPEDWLKKYGTLAALGTETDNHMRFSRNQAGILDALLAAQPDATCDQVFENLRSELHSFESVQPMEPATGFTGLLRDYQKEGLGWLLFLQKFSFGGCLADDMGLGKTVQVLAMLQARYAQCRSEPGDKPAWPSLVVVPRSLVFNWQQEATRFTPGMRVLDYTGAKRRTTAVNLAEYELVLTTYGTLRSDIEQLKDVPFDYVILDEAQAIKNADALTTKSVRLLKCRHRLAMSGTPIQNHLGELWSLLEFLNPGMLGRASVFKLTEAGGRNPAPETRELLAKAIRPFILRRTKSQVAKDLPERTEDTLYCEFDKVQRKLYNELRDHYRTALKAKIDRDGINKSKIVILEALLRLRQAACHQGLIDEKRIAEPSAKLDVLLPQLAEVIEENHKALVFSQFTSFLAILRRQLDKAGIRYEYLDGHTRDRESKVRSFQEDPDNRLFLISLKAGGLGLNLTAAEYVFLLDPWWNPSVEAQAIDRAHRIGQTRKVFAYRLIAKDTVEEKVLELQKTKKDLADSIINADNSLIRTLSREDLELLLA